MVPLVSPSRLGARTRAHPNKAEGKPSRACAYLSRNSTRLVFMASENSGQGFVVRDYSGLVQ